MRSQKELEESLHGAAQDIARSMRLIVELQALVRMLARDRVPGPQIERMLRDCESIAFGPRGV